MSEKLEFDLVVKNNQLDDALGSASQKTGMLQSAMTTALGVFGGGVALKGLELLGNGIGKTVDYAYEAVEAYGKQEDAINKLEQAIRATGDTSASSVEELVSFGDELEQTSKLSGEAILSQLAFAKSLGQTNKQAKDTVQAAAELTATFGGSLEQNVSLLGKTFQGTAGKLSVLVPELKSLTKAQLEAGDAADLILQKFGGAAASEIDSYTGSIHASDNAYDALSKSIGGVIVDVLHLKDINNFLAEVYNTLTEKVLGFRDALDRGDEGFVETEASITRYSSRVAELTNEIEIQETRLASYEQQAKTSWSAAGEVSIAKQNIQDLRKEYDNATKTINDFYAAQSASSGSAKPNAPVVSDEILTSRKQLNDEILALDQQLVLEENNLAMAQMNLGIESDVLRNQAELERMTAFALTKAELDFQLKEQELIRTKDGEDQRLELLKLSGEKELALQKIKNDGIIKAAGATRDEEKKAAAARVQIQEATSSAMNNIIGNSFGLAGALAKDGSKEQFYIQKAGALAQIAIADGQARAMVPAQTSTIPYPLNIAAIAQMEGLISANTALGSSIVAAATLKGFARGGVIGESSQGATMGPDDTIIKARNGEMMLNADDQKNLHTAIKNGQFGGGDIVIMIDEREIARAVRNQKNAGYKI